MSVLCLYPLKASPGEDVSICPNMKKVNLRAPRALQLYQGSIISPRMSMRRRRHCDYWSCISFCSFHCSPFLSRHAGTRHYSPSKFQLNLLLPQVCRLSSTKKQYHIPGGCTQLQNRGYSGVQCFLFHQSTWKTLERVPKVSLGIAKGPTIGLTPTCGRCCSRTIERIWMLP